jgi:hypothetical protein
MVYSGKFVDKSPVLRAGRGRVALSCAIYSSGGRCVAVFPPSGEMRKDAKATAGEHASCWSGGVLPAVGAHRQALIQARGSPRRSHARAAPGLPSLNTNRRGNY